MGRWGTAAGTDSEQIAVPLWREGRIREVPDVSRYQPSDDHERLEDLFELHSRAVRAYAIRRLGPHAADDIVSEVFTTAWRRLG